MADKEDQKSAPITIKKYANRRLYNTATSSYVTLDHLCQMVKDGLDFVVYDAKTGEDITRSVLTQIIVEEESKGQNLLPISFLRQLIGFYGDNMQAVVPRYLEYSMQAFSRNQEQMRDYFQNTLGGMFPFGRLDEVSKQNMQMFERAMRMFTPFGVAGAPDDPAGARPAAPGTPPGVAPAGATFDELKKQIDELQKQIASIASPGSKTESK
ncbi:polyhydroxyalkanoate synthesis repressor PhaR [Azospirillum sp. TSO35-2]|uniref:polyhydroxyalkanoate synthesis repressor PhaR n=1 Tax=Azospirillum sp. TSO35-2 TaxID=716796 RepID=UPI000D61FC62|nr:polyhydroxyalkanoate synthesis repressor PhaR [Azospirillum sp. TSO35-2]PWC35834.1 polyhydroxyalkanoate synthesis repressor [Azospirillum sp. TSO35-2]